MDYYRQQLNQLVVGCVKLSILNSRYAVALLQCCLYKSGHDCNAVRVIIYGCRQLPVHGLRCPVEAWWRAVDGKWRERMGSGHICPRFSAAGGRVSDWVWGQRWCKNVLVTTASMSYFYPQSAAAGRPVEVYRMSVGLYYIAWSQSHDLGEHWPTAVTLITSIENY